MNTSYKYQIDTTQKEGLQLIEEVDEVVEVPKPKKRYFKKKPDTLQKDTTKSYGFKNYLQIPTRKVKEKKNEITNQVEVQFEPKSREVDVASWQTILLVFSFFLLAFIKAFNSNRFKQSYKALFNYSVVQEIIREEKVFFHRVNLVLTLIYVITIGLIILLIREVFLLPNTNKLMLYLAIIGVVVGVYIAKFLISKILFFVYDGQGLADEYVFNVSLYNGLLGILFIPVLSVAFFTTIDITNLIGYITVPLLLLVFAFRVLRLVVIGKSHGILYLYIFLYICTLEILPLVVLIGIFIH